MSAIASCRSIAEDGTLPNGSTFAAGHTTGSLLICVHKEKHFTAFFAENPATRVHWSLRGLRDMKGEEKGIWK